MGLARSTYYDTPTRVVDDTALVDAMSRTVDEFEAYGYRRLGAALRHQGVVVNHKKLRRLMRAHDLQPKRRPRYVATTDSAHEGPIFPNVAKDVVVTGPNQLWVSDITYVALPSRFVNVAIILDAWSRLVVGYGRSIDARLTLGALRAAVDRRQPPPGCIHHSDRGAQYASAPSHSTCGESGGAGQVHILRHTFWLPPRHAGSPSEGDSGIGGAQGSENDAAVYAPQSGGGRGT